MTILNENDTAGFYKYESEQLAGGRWVLNSDFELYADKRTEYNLPVDGWHWFDSIELAQEFFGIAQPVIESIQAPVYVASVEDESEDLPVE